MHATHNTLSDNVRTQTGEILNRHLAAAIDGQTTALRDADTADLFTDISRGVDHQLWLVESHAVPK